MIEGLDIKDAFAEAKEHAFRESERDDRMPRLVGRLIFAGDIEVNGEEISGVALEMDRATLIAADDLPLYKDCIVVRLDQFRNARAELETLRDAVRKLRDVKGRHHTEIAAKKLFELIP